MGYPSNWDEIRRYVLARDGYRCVKCGATNVELHVDHIIPLSRGGSNNPSNLQTLCVKCHIAKHPHMRYSYARRNYKYATNGSFYDFGLISYILSALVVTALIDSFISSPIIPLIIFFIPLIASIVIGQSLKSSLKSHMPYIHDESDSIFALLFIISIVYWIIIFVYWIIDLLDITIA